MEIKGIVISLTISLLLITPIFGQDMVKDTIDYEFLYGTALKGEVPAILEYLDTLKLYKPKDQAFKTKFEKRFKYDKDQTEDYFSKKDTLLNPLHRLFQQYWRKGLLHPQQDNDSLFKGDLIHFFNEENRQHQYAAGKVTEDNLETVYKKYIEDKGYHCTGLGRTGKFYDLMVWRTMEPKTYSIDLIDHTEKVKVYFMEDFLSLGWMDYARLGERYPGGWATKEALYCVTKGYDQSSEKFKIIYLKHEGQHFYDYKHFPKLESADLEYRAKLIEMVFCEEELYNRLAYFLKNAKDDPRNAHPHANYRLISNMSKEIFGNSYEPDHEKWQNIPAEQLHETARKLYKENTDYLLADNLEPPGPH